MPNIASSVRISADANAILDRLVDRLGGSKSKVVERAITSLEQRLFHDEVKQAYATLRQDEAGWKEYMAEVALWDRLASDGLPDGTDW